MRARLLAAFIAGIILGLLISYPARTSAESPAIYSPLPESVFVPTPGSEQASQTVIGSPVTAVDSPAPSEVPAASPSPSDASRTRPLATVKPRLRITKPGHLLIEGTATWYCLPGVSRCQKAHPSGNYAAAGPALRQALGVNWRGQRVIVSANGRSVAVILSDWCFCGSGRIIDLYGSVFSALAPLSRGTLRVRIGR